MRDNLSALLAVLCASGLSCDESAKREAALASARAKFTAAYEAQVRRVVGIATAKEQTRLTNMNEEVGSANQSRRPSFDTALKALAGSDQYARDRAPNPQDLASALSRAALIAEERARARPMQIPAWILSSVPLRSAPPGLCSSNVPATHPSPRN